MKSASTKGSTVKRDDAGESVIASCRARTYDPLIKSQLSTCKSPTRQQDFEGEGATQGATDLQAVVNAWPTLPAAIRKGILAMIEAARKT